MSKFYDEKYRGDALYWGRQPSSIARILFAKYPPQSVQTLLDIGCGEGRDCVFFAHNGYLVTGFDSSEEGVKKSRAVATEQGLDIELFQADINEYRLDKAYDVIFASGALHYIDPPMREEIVSHYKQFTVPGGLHAFTVPIQKAFLAQDPEADPMEHYWRSGEILTLYHDWRIELFAEEILDDIHSRFKFPVNRLIAREPSA